MFKVVDDELERLGITIKFSDEDKKTLLYYLTNHSGCLENLIKDYDEVKNIISKDAIFMRKFERECEELEIISDTSENIKKKSNILEKE